MPNVALYLNPEAFNTKGPALMGRQSAGEGFLRGYLRHARTEAFHFWNIADRPVAELNAFVQAIGAVDRPVTWIARNDRAGLGQAGVMHMASPRLAKESWARRTVRARYGISGITHTTASADVTDMLADMITAPLAPWDALICTSHAVRASVETQLDAVRADLEERLGATRLSKPWLATIPLGVNVDNFATSPEARASWRQELDIPDDAVVVLYVGRFNIRAKMNPAPMAMALQRAAEITGKTIAWVQAGWAGNEALGKAYHDETRSFCPDVLYRVVDGRRPEARFSIWSVGDIFLSLSDNIQETFGLTPVEAMAAGIPSVISDWDGYRDTVRHGIDGYRAATYAPRAGLGGDLAYRAANDWINYDGYVGSASQVTAVDIGEAAQALAELINNPDLRRSMGEAAQLRAREIFDWSAVIPQYEALWDEMNARRRAASPEPTPRRDLALNPRRLDPFLLFGGYPTEWLTPNTFVTLTPGQSAESLNPLLQSGMTNHGGSVLPTRSEMEKVIGRLLEVRQITVGDLIAPFSAPRRPFVERGLLWMAKYQILTILPRAFHIGATAFD
jgi:glycosyltransferase involved in cell wall biosynthesis